MTDTPPALTLYSSWRSLVAGALSPTLLVGFALFGTALAGRVTIVASVVFGIGLVLAGATLFDLPRRTVFDADGIHRRCLLRSQHLPWDQVRAIQRAPGPIIPGPQDPSTARFRRRPGGLTAVVGRRTYLLIDVVEGELEYRELERSLQVWGPAVNLVAQPPPAETTPTWTYHERWRT